MLILAFNSLLQEGKIIILLHTKMWFHLILRSFSTNLAWLTVHLLMSLESLPVLCQCPSRLWTNTSMFMKLWHVIDIIGHRSDSLAVRSLYQAEVSVFFLCRMYYSSGAWNRPHNSHAMLLDKYWIKLQMGTMTREELKKVNALKAYTV